MFHCGPESLSRCSHSLLSERSKVRIPIGEIFSVPVKTDTGTKPDTCAMGTMLFAVVKRSERAFE